MIKIQLAFCSVISDVDLTCKILFAYSLHVFFGLRFGIFWTGSFQEPYSFMQFFASHSRNCHFLFKDYSSALRAERKNIRFCWAMNMNYLKTPRYHRYLLHNLRNKHLPVHTYVRVIFLLLLFLEKSTNQNLPGFQHFVGPGGGRKEVICRIQKCQMSHCNKRSADMVSVNFSDEHFPLLNTNKTSWCSKWTK